MRGDLLVQALLLGSGVCCCWLLPPRDRLAFLLALARRGQTSGPTVGRLSQGNP